MEPPQPAEVAMRIVADVAGGVRPDLGCVRARVAENLLAPDDGYEWPRAERIAVEALSKLWEAELAIPCARALGDAHELALVQAQRCLDAARDLDERGADSWIAGAVLHQLAFDVAWDLLAEEDREPREEGCLETDDG
jgi:hypothetical protein